jgi:hypothetical protein
MLTFMTDISRQRDLDSVIAEAAQMAALRCRWTASYCTHVPCGQHVNIIGCASESK